MRKIKLWFLPIALALLATVIMPTAVLAADTNNEAVIKAPLHQIVFTNNQGTLDVKEIISFQNTGADNFVGNKGASGKTEVLKVSLPEGYQNLKVDGYDQSKLIINPDGFITEDPVAGNSRITMTFSYSMPLSQNGTYVLDKTVKYTTDEMGLFHLKDKLSVSGEGIYSFKPQNVPGMGVFSVYGVQLPGIGKKIDIKVDLNSGTGLNQYDPNQVKFHSASHIEAWNGSPLAKFNPHIFTAFVLVVIISLISAVYIVRKKKNSAGNNDDNEELIALYAQLKQKEKRLLEKMADLDQEHEKGAIGDEEYQETRDAYKKMLVKIKIKGEALKEELGEDGE